jgi:hypothetical protein
MLTEAYEKADDRVCNGNSQHHRGPRKVRMSKSQMKTMLITFIDIKGTVHSEFIPLAYYAEILKWLREAVHRGRPELWPNHWILRHDNAPAHKALSVKQFLAQHPQYSPYLTSNNFWLFPEIKYTLNG